MAAAPEANSRFLPVLATKLSVPPHRSDVVGRPRLTERLAAGLGEKLTLISAPPGFGKTMLVTEWMARSGAGRRVGWLGLDPGDNDPGRFLTYVVSAIRCVEPGYGPGLINLLQTALSGDPTLALVDMINALNDLPDQVVLVLDDYHVITNDHVHRAVSYLLDNQPPSLHIIMTSRTTPPLPLALLRTRRELTEFRADDLRFTLDETSVFLNRAMGLDLPLEQVAALDERTEGWVVGLLLAALSLADAGPSAAAIDSFGGDHRYVFDYLAEEVLRRQPREVGAFLERTSVLGRISAELAEALGASDCQAMIECLTEGNLFTLPLDGQRVWFRYHQMFGEFLSARYRALDPEGWRRAHALASDWYFENGYRSEAAEHALATGDQERIIRIIEAVGSDLLRHGRIPTLTRWLEALPGEVVATRPALTLQMAWATMLGRRFEEAGIWIERVDLSDVSDSRQAWGLRIDLAICRATYARFRGDSDEIILLSSEALDLFAAASKSDHPYVSVALLHLGSALRRRGDTRASVGVLTNAVETSQRGDNHVVELNAMSELAAALGELGAFDEADSWAMEMLARESDYGIRRLAMTEAGRIALAAICREQGAFDEARDHLDDSLNVISVSGDAEYINDKILALYEQALVDVALGNAGTAIEAMDEAVIRARTRDDVKPGSAWRVAGMRAQIQLLLGRHEDAFQWADWAPFPEGDPVTYRDEPVALARAWIDIERGRLDDAERLLTRLVAGLVEAGREHRLAASRLMLAVLRGRQGRRDDAARLLDQAVAWASSRHCLRILIDTHPDVGLMLPDARFRALREDRLEWVGFLDEVIGIEDEQDDPGRYHSLTEREREVLALLKEGISNREIAERLYLTVGTIKRHTHNIYAKLGVSNRTQAILRGQELGLLERA